MVKIPPHVFREYDIRGFVDQDLSPRFAYLLGRAYGSLAKESKKNRIAVGYDARHSSPSYASQLIQGLMDEGIDALATGIGPTPQLYYSIFKYELGGGIMVTGSHNPPDMNGFKICLGTHTLSGREIQDLYTRMQKLTGKPNENKKGTAADLAVKSQYTRELIDNCLPYFGKRKLKVVADGGNGVGGLVGPQVLRGLGVEVVELFCNPDGDFPNHHPDPTVLKNLTQLIAKVSETKADFGVAWDGDADRIGVVDERGRIIYGDMLLLIYAREILKDIPDATIIGDVKCSDLLFQTLEKLGANPIMWKTGHSLIKDKLKQCKGQLAGEMSAHIFFKHRYFGFDDAIYASARLCEIMSKSEGCLSDLLKDLPTRISTPEIRVDCPEDLKFSVVKSAQQAFSEFPTNTIDGVRITFEKGWGLVRASNTQPVLVLRFEADTEANLERYRAIVTDRITAIRHQLENS